MVLTRKERPFIWGKEQDSFEKIKYRLIKPPVLHMPNTMGMFHLYSDTSKFATRSALYQIQNGKPKVIAYTSKRSPEAAKNYSITDVELCRLAINIASFSHLLKRIDFDATMDHLSPTHIIKSKAEPAIIRMNKLLELISSYSFNLYYIKGKDMVLSDFLSRQNNDDSNPHEIIPISFNMHQVLHKNYYNTENYLVQTRFQARSSGIKLLEDHGMGKNLDPNIKPEKQCAIPVKGSIEKPCIGQGRAGLKRKRSDPINQTINPPSKLSQIFLERHKRPLFPDVPFHPGLAYRHPPKPIRSNVPRSQESSQSSPSSEIFVQILI